MNHEPSKTSSHENRIGNGLHGPIQNGAERSAYLTDAPISDPAHDAFRRLPFAERIAETLASLNDPSSIVVGIYGNWGEGKTTVLNFIEQKLREHSHVACIRFNPWLFRDEPGLVRSFFTTLRNELGKSPGSTARRLRKNLSDYAQGIADAVSLSIGPVQISGKDLRECIKQKLPESGLLELKQRIDEVLLKEQRRVVILMDDIDRLDKYEIQAVFKLVKLSADFSYTAYILAFDADVVAKALGERYGSGDPSAGRAFLEKIVQVPLTLPPASRVSLRRYCLRAIEDTLEAVGVQLTQRERSRFGSWFKEGLEAGLKTPRAAKRYANALAFAVPLLRDEVNLVDLMLLEGLKIFYPNVYHSIRQHPGVYLANSLEDRVSRVEGSSKAYDRREAIVRDALNGLTSEEARAARSVLEFLFPRLEDGIFGRASYDSDYQQWVSEKRVCAEQYFDRYFSYGIPEGDFPDQAIVSILSQAAQDGPDTAEALVRRIRESVDGSNAETFVLKLRLRVTGLSPKASKKLAIAIGRTGDLYPNEISFSDTTTTFHDAAMLVRQLVDNVPEGEARLELARLIMKTADPIPFAVQCFTVMYSGPNEAEEMRVFTEHEQECLGKELASRVKQVATGGDSLFFRYPKDVLRLLSVWKCWDSAEEVAAYVKRAFMEDPHTAITLLKCCVPTVHYKHDHPTLGDFDQESYNKAVDIVPADAIYNALQSIYGASLESPKCTNTVLETPDDERLARQFIAIYRNADNSG